MFPHFLSFKKTKKKTFFHSAIKAIDLIENVLDLMTLYIYIAAVLNASNEMLICSVVIKDFVAVRITVEKIEDNFTIAFI